MNSCLPWSSILFLALVGCYVPVADVYTDKHPYPGGSSDSGAGDTAEVTDTGVSEDTGGTSDSSSDETNEPSDTSSSDCSACEGVTSISSSEISVKADGTDTGSASVDIFGWTTGLELRCADTISHLAWSFDTTDTSTTGYARLTLGVTKAYRGDETGICALSSDYGRTVYLSVTLSPCPECTGITGCADDELFLWVGYPWKGGTSSLACGGTATGIEVTCTGFDTDPTFYYSVDTTDSSTDGVFMLTVGSGTEGVGGTGTCTLTSEQDPTVDVCVWKCTVAGCVSPC